MCGRYLLIAPVEALRRLFGVEERPNLMARYNIAPTQDAPVVRIGASGGRELALLRWGLVPSWAKDASGGAMLINARGDTVASKPSFRAAYRLRRCLVPADGFYEWMPGKAKGPKQPFLIARADRATFAFAGLWERWHGDGRSVESFTIVTTDANASLKPIHPRMPVILAADDYDAWLDLKNADAQALLRPAPDELLTATPVSTRVNAVANDDAALIEPVAVTPEPKPEPPAQGRLF